MQDCARNFCLLVKQAHRHLPSIFSVNAGRLLWWEAIGPSKFPFLRGHQHFKWDSSRAYFNSRCITAYIRTVNDLHVVVGASRCVCVCHLLHGMNSKGQMCRASKFFFDSIGRSYGCWCWSRKCSSLGRQCG
jgi:hypothetical protein